MPGGARRPIIPDMTTPSSSSKLILALDRRAAAGPTAPAGPIRRYRIARLRFDTPEAGPEHRFDYLKRTFD